MVMPPPGPPVPPGQYPPPGPPPPMTPAGAPPAYPMVAPTPYFRSLRGLATAMYVLLPLSGLVALAMIPVALHARSVVHDRATFGAVVATREVRDATDAVSGVAGIGLLVSLAITVLFIIWMWRAAKNLPFFGRVRPKFGPGFAIGGWFIPFANFIIPGMQMFDIDKGSGPRLRGGERPRGSALVVVWWLFFIAGRAFGLLAPTFEPGKAYDVGAFDVQNTLLIVGSAATAIAAVAAILVIRQITTAQEAGLADLGVATATPAAWSPPPMPGAPVASPPIPTPYVPPAPYAPPPPVPPTPPAGEIWPGPPESPGSDPQ